MWRRININSFVSCLKQAIFSTMSVLLIFLVANVCDISLKKAITTNQFSNFLPLHILPCLNFPENRVTSHSFCAYLLITSCVYPIQAALNTSQARAKLKLRARCSGRQRIKISRSERRRRSRWFISRADCAVIYFLAAPVLMLSVRVSSDIARGATATRFTLKHMQPPEREREQTAVLPAGSRQPGTTFYYYVSNIHTRCILHPRLWKSIAHVCA